MGIKREDTIFLQHSFFCSGRHTALDQPMVVFTGCLVASQAVGVIFCNFQQDLEPNTQGKSQGPP